MKELLKVAKNPETASKKLRELSESRYKKIRETVSLNPNTSTEDLKELFVEFPKAYFNNPINDYWKLTNSDPIFNFDKIDNISPSMWEDYQITIYQYARENKINLNLNAIFKKVLFNTAGSWRFFSYNAVTLYTSLYHNLYEDFFNWAILEYFSTKNKKIKRSIIEIITTKFFHDLDLSNRITYSRYQYHSGNNLSRAQITSNLCDNKIKKILDMILDYHGDNKSYLQSDYLKKIYRCSYLKFNFFDLVPYIKVNDICHNILNTFHRKLSKKDIDIIFWKIAKKRNYKFLLTIVNHLQFTFTLLQRFLLSNDVLKRKALAQSPYFFDKFYIDKKWTVGLDEEFTEKNYKIRECLEKLLNDKSPLVRCELVKNPYITKEFVFFLSHDPDSRVLSEVIHHTYTSPTTLKRIMLNHDNEEINRALLSNAKLTPDLTRKLIKRAKKSDHIHIVNRKTFRFEYLDLLSTKILLLITKKPNLSFPVREFFSNHKIIKVRESFAQRYPYHDTIAYDKSPRVRVHAVGFNDSILKNDKESFIRYKWLKYHFDELCIHYYVNGRSWNKNSDMKKVKDFLSFSNDKSPDVRALLVELILDHLKSLKRCNEDQQYQQLYFTVKNTIIKLSNDESFLVRKKISGYEEVPPKALDNIYKSPTSIPYIEYRSLFPYSVIVELEHSIKRRSKIIDKKPFDRLVYGKQPGPKIIDFLISENNSYIRLIAARHRRTSTRTLLKLSMSRNKDLKIIANESLIMRRKK